MGEVKKSKKSMAKIYHCKWCGRAYTGRPIAPKGAGVLWHLGHNANNPGQDSSYYCSEKCRDEAAAVDEDKKAAKRAAYESEDESDSGDVSSLTSSGGGGIGSAIVGGVVVIIVVIIILGAIFGKNEDMSDPAVQMDKWAEHLEKRRTAFEEGLSEEAVEARGLKNYTWEEWQTQHSIGQKNGGKNEALEMAKGMLEALTSDSSPDTMRGAWKEHMKKRDAAFRSGHTEAEINKMGLYNYNFPN